MKRIFQTKFGVPTGNCFNAAVASILDLDYIPDIDPTLDDVSWRVAWCDFFDAIGVRWTATSWEPEHSNWDYHPKGLSIGVFILGPGVRHAVVCYDGIPVHDVYPGSQFVALPTSEQKKYPIEAWTSLSVLGPTESNNRVELGALAGESE